VHDYGIACETDGDIALLVAPFAGFEPYDIITTRRVAQNAGDILVFHAGFHLGVILGGNFATGGEEQAQCRNEEEFEPKVRGRHMNSLMGLG